MFLQVVPLHWMSELVQLLLPSYKSARLRVSVSAHASNWLLYGERRCLAQRVRFLKIRGGRWASSLLCALVCQACLLLFEYFFEWLWLPFVRWLELSVMSASFSSIAAAGVPQEGDADAAIATVCFLYGKCVPPARKR